MQQVHKSIALADRSSVGEARRAAVSIAQALGFDEQRRNDIGIVATEAANNIVLHAKSGELLVCPFEDGLSTRIDMMAIDAGPGIPDVARAMEDGYSTHGTAGQGLGAINRLSDSSSLYSAPQKGTIYWSQFKLNKEAPSPALGVVSVPIRGETVCGDGYLILPGDARSLYLVVDGLGHGAGANEAAQEALSVARSLAREDPVEIIRGTHDALKKTRGAAMSVGVLNHDQKIFTYAGIGNISATLKTGTGSRSLVSQNGTLGAIMPRVPQQYTYPVERNTLLFMFSDGLTSKLDITAYTGILGRHPALVAGLLYRDFTRKRDDSTILVARMEKEGE